MLYEHHPQENVQHEDRMKPSSTGLPAVPTCVIVTRATSVVRPGAKAAPPLHKEIEMKRSVFVFAGAAAIVAGSVLAAQQQGAKPAAPMGFFVTSVGLDGGNLGGLQGADAHCQKLAAASGQPGAGERVWRAYLSTQGPNAVNARDRIGQGPWANARGGIVARDVAHLHGDTVEAAQLGSNLSKTTALTEKNTPVLGAGDMGPEGKPLNQHDILTGSTPAGNAFPAGEDRTCNNWTSNSTGAAQVGHFDRTGGGNASWNSAHASKGCSGPNLVATGGNGYFYCFAEK
jgi:hypothetical protein